MLNKIFSTDNTIFQFFNTLGYIWWLHILWLICSLPIITIGASTTALCYSCMKLRKKDGYVTQNFFRSFKENFRQSTILFLFFLIIGSVLLADLILTNQIDSGFAGLVRMATLALMVPYVMTLLYAFAVQAKFVNPVVKTLKYSFGVALKYFGYTIQIFLIVAGVLWLNTTIVLANFVTLTIGVGVVGYLVSMYYGRIFEGMIGNK